MLLAYRRTVVTRFSKQEVSMFNVAANSEIGRKLAAIVCTIVFSATCVVGAVGPATAGSQAVVSAARLSA
jgi:hypothetical protein